MPPLLRASREALTSIAALLAEAHPDETFSPDGLERIIFGDPSFDPALFFEETAGGSLVAAVAGAARAGDRYNPCAVDGCAAGFVKLLIVDEAARRRGVGGALLRELEDRLRGRGCGRLFVDGAAPACLRPGLDARSEGALGFFSRRGYRVIGERESLVVSTSTSASAGAGAGTGSVEVRRAGAGDRARLEIEEMFSAEWAYEAGLALRVDPPGLHLALLDGKIVGFAASGVSAPDVFGPMGVAPDRRGRGLGAELYRRAVADIRGRGYERALISWIGPAAFYERLSPILETRRYLVLEKQL